MGGGGVGKNGTIQIISDTLEGEGGLAKVSPNITWGGGEGGWQKYYVTICFFACFDRF